MEIRPISADEARTVRWPVLRAGMPPESAILDHDDDPGTRHFGAFEGERLVGVATFFAEPCPGRPGRRAWRLRGMATFAEMQGRGAGRALVPSGVGVALADGADLMWCPPRTTARGFYQRLGFTAFGNGFRVRCYVGAGMMIAIVTIILFEELWGDTATAARGVVLAANLPWLLVPLAVIGRMRREDPFGVPPTAD